jgi:hypothetical protein
MSHDFGYQKTWVILNNKVRGTGGKRKTGTEETCVFPTKLPHQTTPGTL